MTFCTAALNVHHIIFSARECAGEAEKQRRPRASQVLLRPQYTFGTDCSAVQLAARLFDGCAAMVEEERRIAGPAHVAPRQAAP